MTDSIKSYCECTEYSKIFKNTYWGSFKTEKQGVYEEQLPLLCENRNKFIEEHSIISCVTHNKRFWKKIEFFRCVFRRIEQEKTTVDHREFYDTGHSIIGISSHYCHDYEHIIWQKYGFRLIEPLYQTDQSTYMYEYFYK